MIPTDCPVSYDDTPHVYYTVVQHSIVLYKILFSPSTQFIRFLFLEDPVPTLSSVSCSRPSHWTKLGNK